MNEKSDVLDKYRRLLDVCLNLTQIYDIDKLLDYIMTAAMEVLSAEASSLLLQEDDLLLFKVAKGEKESVVKNLKLKVGEGVVGWVAKYKTPLIVNNAYEDPRFNRDIDKLTGFRTKNIICVPMKTQKAFVGVIEVLNKKKSREFTEADEKILMAFAGQTAIALDNVRLYQRLNSENALLRNELRASREFSDIIGRSRKITDVLDLACKVAPSRSTVFIQGESGTGKELIAKAIHFSGGRRDRPFIKVNCAAIPETLLESELFGHEKGAFTGAINRKLGRFELADGGTIFLDEIAEIPVNLQLKLLRVLQEREFERVGGVETIKVDVRVIAATNKDIAKALKDGMFREDLYYRLSVVPVSVPPLREHKEDIPLLTAHFIKKYNNELNRNISGITEDALALLKEYDWPGNIRELENTIERAIVISSSNTITADHLSNITSSDDAREIRVGLALKEAIDTFKISFIKKTLDHTGGSKKKAAEILKIQRTYLSNLIKYLKIR